MWGEGEEQEKKLSNGKTFLRELCYGGGGHPPPAAPGVEYSWNGCNTNVIKGPIAANRQMG